LHFVGMPPWAQQEQLNYEKSLGSYPLSPTKPGGEQDIGVGMNRAQQRETQDKLFSLLQGGGANR
jgi:hypothetical protein